jgi:microsomal dipeptidase-like Zn-dependent dipeptidase
MTDKPTRPEWEILHEQAIIVDLHAHPVLKRLLFHRSLSRRVKIPSFFAGDLNPIDVQTSFPNLEMGKIDVLFSAAYPLEKRIFEDIMIFEIIPLKWIHWLPILLVEKVWKKVYVPPYFDVALTMLKTMEEAARHYNRKHPKREVHFAHSSDELKKELSDPSKPIVLVHSVEGGHSLEGKFGLQLKDTPYAQLTVSERETLKLEVMTNLEKLRERGVAYLVLAHFYPNKLIMPVFPYPEHIALELIPRYKLEDLWHDVNLAEGLTDLGRDVVRRMIEIGMLIDISHATPKARQEIYDLVDKSMRKNPIIVATHVGAYAINPSPYNLADWEIKWIAKHEGVVGVIFMSSWLMPGDTKFGLNFISQTMEHIINLVGDDYVAIGTDFDGADPPDDLIDESRMLYLTERLFSEYLETGHRKYTNEQIEKILGGNALRVLYAGWGQPSG